MSLMKKIIFAASVLTLGLGLLSCGGAHGNDPGHAYMPDMYYARAYEAYGYNMVEGELDSLRQRGILYNGLPVPGTVAREDMLPYHLTDDSTGLSAANGLVNPLDTLSKVPGQLKEGERLYLVNCGICHGPALDGNGPLYKGGEGPYPAKPQVLNDAQAAGWTDGHFYHVITYGKGQMGSYASQLRPEQRWLVINYIRSKQTGAKSDTAAKESSTPMNQTNVNPTGQDSSKTK
ncbi:MAG: cytochrome c [Chitinophagaceae bacterium]|nr:MAG: cytochrome c [Chitinophagaceae bacterium]